MDGSSRLKLAEVAVALLFLVVSVWIGRAANRILERQNMIVAQQAAAAERTGHQQYQAALLQGYVTANAGAGYGTQKELRMMNLALDLYFLLEEEDPRYQMLATSMPDVDEEQLRQIIEKRPKDRVQILRLYRRRGESKQVLGDRGPYHIVLATFRDPAGAQRTLIQAVEFLRPTGVEPHMNIVRNAEGLYSATLSSFSSKEEAEHTIGRLRLADGFPSAYVSLGKRWRVECHAQFSACRTPGLGLQGPPPPLSRLGRDGGRSSSLTPDARGRNGGRPAEK